jgi:hypothetical protein
MVAAVFLSLAGGWMALAGFRNGLKPAQTPAFDRTAWSVLALFALSIIYQQAIVYFGYELPTAIIGPIALWLFGVHSKLGLALSVVLFPLCFHIIFFRLLGAFPPYGEYFNLTDWLGV